LAQGVAVALKWVLGPWMFGIATPQVGPLPLPVMALPEASERSRGDRIAWPAGESRWRVTANRPFQKRLGERGAKTASCSFHGQNRFALA